MFLLAEPSAAARKRGAALWLAALSLTAGPAAAQTGAQAAQPAAAAAPRRVDLNEYVVSGNTVLDQVTIERAVLPHLGPDKTLDDVEAARAALLVAYQQRGYQSVVVALPEQQVQGGVIHLQVTETPLGKVEVVGARYNAPERILAQVPALSEGKIPDFTAAQAQLTELNRGAKRQVVPLLRPGKEPGTLDVELKVDDRSPWLGSASLNNDYSAGTSHLRSAITLGNDNLFGRGQVASLTFFTSPRDIHEVKVLSGSYLAPLAGTPWSLQLSGYRSDSAVATIGGTNVLGKGHSVGLSGIYRRAAQGDWTSSLSLGIDFKDFQQQLRFAKSSTEVPIRYAPLSLGYTVAHADDRSYTSLNTTLVAGFRGWLGYGSSERDFDNQRYKADQSFVVLKSDLNHTYNFRNDVQLAARLSGQLASGALVSNEQIAAGGVNTVRGYLSAQATGDYGVIGSLELRSPSLARYLNGAAEEWRVYGFTDTASLWLHDALVEQQDRYSLASAGFGSRFEFRHGISAGFDLGMPLARNSNGGSRHPRLHFQVRASY